MKIVETEAIVLKAHSLSEADKIILFFTKENGLVRLSVRGAKRLKNRFGGRLEFFTIANLVYAQKEETELGRLIQIELIESFFNLAGKLNVFRASSYFSEILTAITPLNEPNEKLYRMMRVCLETIAFSKLEQQLIRWTVLYFEIWLLRLAGFLPDFRNCAECRQSVKERAVYFRIAEANLICAACVNANQKGELLNVEWHRLLRAALLLHPAEFVELAERSNVEIKHIESVTHRLLQKILEYQPDYWFEVIAAQSENAV